MTEERKTEQLTVDLGSIIRDVLHDGWMVVTAAIAAVLAMLMLLQLTYVPVYTSKATIMITARGGSGSASTDWAVTDSISATFAQLLNSSLLKKKVQQEMGLEQLPGAVQVSVIPSTNLIQISVQAGHPREAFRTLRGILDHYDTVTDYVMSNVVLDELEPPSVPTAPSNTPTVPSLIRRAAVLGAGAMLVLLAVMSVMRDTVRNEEEAERKLDSKLFATIYHERKGLTPAEMIKGRKKSLLVTGSGVSFQFVENFKKLRTRLIYHAKGRPCQVLLVTSVAENEGKSTVAANIALSLAQKMKHVVLVEGDLRRPAVHKILEQKVMPENELCSFLRGKIQEDGLLKQLPGSELNLIMSGRHAKDAHQLISGQRMSGLIHALRGMCDYIVIDSPPMSMTADALELSKLADVSLLVVRQNTCVVPAINDAVDTLEEHTVLLGYVFNDVKTGVLGLRGHGGYGYGYGSSYGRYGYGYGYGRTSSKSE